MEIRPLLKKISSSSRAIESCKNLWGVEIKHHKNLDRVSNVRWHNGMLQDGTMHFTHRTEVSGNTWPAKDLLKKWGARWDAGRKCWWFPASKASTADVAKRLRKVASKRSLFA